MATSSQLSPGGAVAIGLACCATGAFVVLLVLGAFGEPPIQDTPAWIGVCVALVFVLGGLALIVGYAVAGGVAPDGDLPPGTPLGVRLLQYLLGLGITTSMALIGSWVAFGPGVRHFTGGGSFGRGVVNEMVGRVAFGFGAILAWAVLVVLGVVGFGRLRRRRPPPT